MQPPPLPESEAARLETLRDYRILDTAPETAFDELAELARFACQTPTALITLVDAKRQWFKSRIAWPFAESARRIAFCAHTIVARDLFIVTDAAHDERFADHPLVTGEPHVRSYAGAPLIAPNGEAIGALAVIDYQPRTLDAGQLDALRVLARQVVSQLELRRRIQLEQRQHEHDQERFELLARATNDAVWDWDLVTNEIWWNEGLRTLFGLPPDEVPTIESWSARIHPDDAPRIEQSLYGAINSGERYWSDEYRFRRHDGEYAEIFDRGYIIYADGKPVRAIGAMLDITERRRLEEQLRQSQKMEAVGQLSGGIAHDFNNLLTVIQVNAALIARGQPNPAVKEHADDIIHASDRAATLTRQLLMVSKKQVMQMSVVDVNDVVRNMMRMLQRTLGEHIVLEAHCSTQLPLVKADIGMLEQVLLNLAVNARDAMPSGGTLTIATGEKMIATERGGDAVPGPHVFVAVSDTGVGIKPELLPHIFEPFFTTKEPGKGSGLGLATVYAILRQHHGFIEVASTLARGSTFLFYLPITSEHRTTSSQTLDEYELPNGTETVLVVEDEAALRNLVVGVLESCGYTVLAASSGVEALAVWKAHSQVIDVLLTDLVMPGGVTGRALSQELRAEKPGLRVIYTSGYTAAQAGEGEPLVEGVNFLQKPYQPGKLARVVRDVIDRR